MTTHVLWVLVHSLALVVFINRYVAGPLLRTIRGAKWDETVEFEPTVTAVIPMFNEGRAILETLQSILDSDYPHAKLRIICVDDCSTDDSYELARGFARSSKGRLSVMRNPKNIGKRCSIIRAVREAENAEIILSVDSDVVVDKDAVRQLVRRFTKPEIAAVGGWIDVRNKQQNWLTRMQVIRYWFAYNFSKNLEWGFRRVMCLSGCLTAYRRSVLVELEPVLENRAICGVPIKYGEDRFLTRQVVKAGYLTTMTLTARCATTVPHDLSGYFSQQLRWRRSNTIDYAGGFTHVWRLNPIIAIHYFSLFALQFAYPLAIIRALASHKFFDALEIHIGVMALFGLFYRWKVRHLPKEERVGAFDFLPLSVLMPVAYALLAPLALFTLDSGSWETRGTTEAAPESIPVEPITDISSAAHLVPERSRNVGRQTGAEVAVRQLPAA